VLEECHGQVSGDQASVCAALALADPDGGTGSDAVAVVNGDARPTAADLDGKPSAEHSKAKPRHRATRSARSSDDKPSRRGTRPTGRSEIVPRRPDRPVPKVAMPRISSAWFGGGVSLYRFRITGDTRSQIISSIRRRGPSGGAEGETRPAIRYRFGFVTSRGRCRVVAEARPSVTVYFRVTLPTWAATVGTDRATAAWWARELRDTAAHERHHVLLYRNAARRASQVVATSTCRNVGRRLNAIWRQASIDNCLFDVAEYGRAYGISARSCYGR
jgi:predicted secreted Zn-dependent protease